MYVTDDYSAAGIAGTAGIAIELVRLFAVELEHYEKIEGVPLTFDGKANRLSSMVRGNLGAAMQGLAVVPLLVGYDLDADERGPGGPHRLVRRRRRPLRGTRRIPRGRFGIVVREVGTEEDLFAGHRRGRPPCGRPSNRCTTRQTTIRPPVAPT